MTETGGKMIPRPVFKTVEFSQPQPQYPIFGLLVDDLKRGYRKAHPEQFDDDESEGVCFVVRKKQDGRSGTLEAHSTRQEGSFLIARHVFIEIEDNRPIRRREVEIPARSDWIPA